MSVACLCEHLCQHFIESLASSPSWGRATARVHRAMAVFSNWPLSCDFIPALAPMLAVRRFRVQDECYRKKCSHLSDSRFYPRFPTFPSGLRLIAACAFIA